MGDPIVLVRFWVLTWGILSSWCYFGVLTWRILFFGGPYTQNPVIWVLFWGGFLGNPITLARYKMAVIRDPPFDGSDFWKLPYNKLRAHTSNLNETKDQG